MRGFLYLVVIYGRWIQLRYNDDFSINEPMLETVIEHLIASGVQGLIFAGTTGEYYAQSQAEQISCW